MITYIKKTLERGIESGKIFLGKPRNNKLDTPIFWVCTGFCTTVHLNPEHIIFDTCLCNICVANFWIVAIKRKRNGRNTKEIVTYNGSHHGCFYDFFRGSWCHVKSIFFVNRKVKLFVNTAFEPFEENVNNNFINLAECR